MPRFLIYIGRFGMIACGFVLALMAAASFLHMLAMPALGLQADDLEIDAMSGMLISVPILAMLIGYFAFLPAALFIALAEISRCRGFLPNSIAGAIIALLVPFISDHGTTLLSFLMIRSDGAGLAPAHVLSDMTSLVLIGTGLIGGMAYWLVAGRNAGKWQDLAKRDLTA